MLLKGCEVQSHMGDYTEFFIHRKLYQCNLPQLFLDELKISLNSANQKSLKERERE